MRFETGRRLLICTIVSFLALSHIYAQEGVLVSADDALSRSEEFAKERTALESRLINIIQQDATDEDALKRKKSAVLLLGKIGTEKSVPVLINILASYFEPSTDGIEITDHNDESKIPPTPAMKALALLGPIAVEPLVDALTSETQPAVYRIREQAIDMLPCKSLVIAVLEARIKTSNNSETIKLLMDTRNYQKSKTIGNNRTQMNAAKFDESSPPRKVFQLNDGSLALSNWKSLFIEEKRTFEAFAISFFSGNVAVVNHYEKGSRKDSLSIKPYSALIWRIKDGKISVNRPNQPTKEDDTKIDIKDNNLYYTGVRNGKPDSIMLERDQKPLAQDKVSPYGEWHLFASEEGLDIRLYFTPYGTGAMFVVGDGGLENPEMHQLFTYKQEDRKVSVKCEAWGEQDRVYTLNKEGQLETKDPEDGQVYRFYKVKATAKPSEETLSKE